MTSQQSANTVYTSDNALIEGVQVLGEAADRIRDGESAFHTLERLCTQLLTLRNTWPKETWKEFGKQIFPAHPLAELVHQSPFSRRSFHQPRGYPGDAVTLDYIYDGPDLSGISDLGRECYFWERQTASCRSVRTRKGLLAEYIDAAAARTPKANILSVACGHVRELEHSCAARTRTLGTFHAIDHDPETLEVVRRTHPQVSARQASVRQLLSGDLAFDNIDLAYAAGLYDYLPDAPAKALTAILFSSLRHGGKVLVANFHPALRDIGIMETVMDWWLLYRNEQQMEELCAEIPESALAQRRTFRDTWKNIVYLELEKL